MRQRMRFLVCVTCYSNRMSTWSSQSIGSLGEDLEQTAKIRVFKQPWPAIRYKTILIICRSRRHTY